MNISFEMIEGQRFASRGKEPDNIGILDSYGRTFMIQRRRDGTWVIPPSQVAAWDSEADQDFAAHHYDGNEIAERVGADADPFGRAAALFDQELGVYEAAAMASVLLASLSYLEAKMAERRGFPEGNRR